MKVLTIEPVRPAWMQLHNAIKYSGFPAETVRDGLASGAIRGFTLRSQYHKKFKGVRPQIVLVNVESLDRFIASKEVEAEEVAKS